MEKGRAVITDRDSGYRKGKEHLNTREECTHVNEMVRWNRCLSPRNMANDFGGKDRAVTVQYGCS